MKCDERMPHENIRSIIEITDKCYAIVLPKSWIRYYKLKAKDTLRVVSNGKITIFPPKKENRGKKHDKNG